MTTRSRYLLLIWCALTCALASACSKSIPVDVGTSNGHGIVRRVDYDHHMITLDHDLIPNLLQAMTFAYRVKSDSMMNGLAPGDEVNFVLTESTPGEFLVQSIRKTSNAPKPLVSPSVIANKKKAKF